MPHTPIHHGAITVNGCNGSFTIPPTDYTEPATPHYEGVQLQHTVPLGLVNAAGASPHIVHVTGSGGNPWGHSLFWIDPSVGFVHAAAPGKERVFFIPPDQWDEYATQNNKTILQLVPLPGWNPTSALGYLATKMLIHFNWHVGKHDCSIFCQQLANAGGIIPGNAGSKSMFPTKAVKRNLARGIADRIRW